MNDDKITIEDLKEMKDDKVIRMGYCPECYSKLAPQSGCKVCPVDPTHVDLCG